MVPFELQVRRSVVARDSAGFNKPETVLEPSRRLLGEEGREWSGGWQEDANGFLKQIKVNVPFVHPYLLALRPFSVAGILL